MKLLVRGARQLLTLCGTTRPRRGAELRELGLIRDGAVLIEDGVIQQVGTTRRVENLTAAAGAAEIDATGRVVMPGFVDSHTHLLCGCCSLSDGGAEIRKRSAGRLQARARAIVHDMARHGSTTIEAKSDPGLGASGERKSFRVLSALDGHPLDVAATHLAACDTSQRPCWKRAAFADIVCDGRPSDLEQARAWLDRARQSGFALKVHTDQFHRAGGAALAVEQRAASADHLEYAGADDIGLLAGSDTVATLLPGASFYLDSRYAPGRELIDAGAAVALATDFNPHTSPTYSMPMVISLACAKLALTPEEAISAATINGAHALCRAHRIGSLEPGKQADLILLNASDYREIALHFGVNPVHMTVKRGVAIYEEGTVG